MTIQHPAFWLYLLCLLALGLGTIGYILVTQYHPSLELRDAFIVLDTGTTNISVQWASGVLMARRTSPPEETNGSTS